MLKNGVEHQDLCSDHFDRRSKLITATRLVAELKTLGCEVALQPAGVAA